MEDTFDVAVIGAGIAGSSTAYLMKRQIPGLRIVLIEKSEQFDRKVGESTSEVSAGFLTRVVNLAQHLGHDQLSKSGLRFWFYGQSDDCFTRCSELGPKVQTRLPTFQLDRAKLDQAILEKALAAGCDLLRPAKLLRLELGGEGNNELEIGIGNETRKMRVRWVVDASGRVATIARKLNLYHPLKEHPTNAVWARFRQTSDLDGSDLWEQMPQFAEPCWVMRQWATNHLMGYGWWCWIIPLKGGDFSAGVTYDTRIYQLPEGPTLGDRLKAHLLIHPLGRRLFANAHFIENDVRAFSMLPYYSEQTIGDGWVLVGDSAGFLDPLYSPGLDFVSYTVNNAVTLLSDVLSGKNISKAKDFYNKRYQEQFHTWFNGVFKDKYYYMGDAELMSAAMLMDVTAYFMGPVRKMYGNAPDRYTDLPYGGPVGQSVGKFMRLYNRRLAKIAQRRMAAGTYGRRNSDRRMLLPGFSPDAESLKLATIGLRLWAKAEWQNLFLRTTAKSSSTEPVPAASSRS